MKILFDLFVYLFALIGFAVTVGIGIAVIDSWHTDYKSKRKNLKWYVNRVTQLEEQIYQAKKTHPMKTITTEQFNALPEERRKYWKEEPASLCRAEWPIYTPIQINLEDAERVLEETRERYENHINKLRSLSCKKPNDMELQNSISVFVICTDYLNEAINNLKQLTK